MAYYDDLDKEALDAHLGAKPITTQVSGDAAGTGTGAKAPTSNTMPIAGTLPAATVDPRDPSRTSANAPRVSQAAGGGWQLQEHGNTRALVGQEVDDAKGYADQFWRDNPTGFQAGNAGSLGDAYQQFLGRAPDAEGLAAHQRNPGGFVGALNTIIDSPEAQARRTNPTITNMGLGGAAGTAPAAGAGRRGSWGNLNLDAPTQRNINQFSGFNSARALAGEDDDSVKDAFQRWAGGLDFDLRGKSKQQIEDFYRSQLQSAKDYGLDIQDVKGEKILINTKERGPEWIDSVIGAGGDNPMFGWQAEFDNIGNAALGGGGAAAPAPVTRPAVLGSQDTTMRDRLAAEVQALIDGGASPEDAAALMQQLQA